MHYTNCGSPLEEGSAFCTNCGQPAAVSAAATAAAGSMATGSADETAGSETGSDTIASDGTPDIGTVTDGTVAADSDPTSGISSDAAEFSSGNSMTFTTKIFLLFLLIALAAGVIIAYNRFGKNRDTEGDSNE